ncbi:ABC transporter ATP-binding protein [Longirhabdus pacifica]|uniref:ABC transporter ATP-binding protein n=1 Tax=Longirhabdus pacifica TaxID=2305227 RepID=UPI001008C839|nr:ABC transporter ATP-binding protein [Longirhabdus pacifica]
MKRSKNLRILMSEGQLSKKLFTIGILLNLIQVIVMLLIPWLAQFFIDSFINKEPFMYELVLIIFLSLIQMISGGIAYFILSTIGINVVANLRKKLWNKVLSLPMTYYDNQNSGSTVSRITNDTSSIMSLISYHLVNFIVNSITIIGAISFLLILDWQMTLLMIVILPLIALVIIPLGKKIYHISKYIQDQYATLTKKLMQALGEIKLVKSSNSENYEKENGNHSIESVAASAISLSKIYAFYYPFMNLIVSLLTFVIIGVGIYRLSMGFLTAGELVSYMLYLFRVTMPVTQMGTFFNEIQRTRGATERISELLKETDEDSSESITCIGDTIDFTGDIHFKNVNFVYDRKDILNNISLNIPAGKVIAIVGPSGSGKSTIFSLLQKYYHPVSGEIYIDGVSVKKVSNGNLRSHIGYVLQESPIIDGTILENLTYGINRAVTKDDIDVSLRLSHSKQFINEFPDGISTIVGERGLKLSGGQKQRISIARIFLKKTPIVLLDEATSNVDPDSEEVIQKGVQNLIADRTTIIIAHRLSTVMHADLIYVLEQGNITGSGTHTELMRNNEYYKAFVNKHQYT